ncbi:dTDP-4-dehydrorhamnose 3,5-epimerase [Aquabacterium olei]|uniref:dTDP-4-dehydrorhamnose 3,5-epimerase n=1 Tax=Aquabacterium olei TaxID=1296669 RepID=A0A2U8FTT2_9BURK|nr:dTDP-4-dehydrorhamnose 3,5-epimerase [Aquabacterium olei]AWI54463.1 dTDP-4-dehydrorhamnose 3,5-epimerase [Aquabacterium olei]
MKFIETDLHDVLIIEPAVFSDDRGWFMESFNQTRFESELARLGRPVPKPFIQDNHSCSRKGVLRGMHYQLAPRAQGKLVRVVKGAAFDVAVDIRKDSRTFGKWVGVKLTAGNCRQLWIPEGFAHGFLSLEDETHFLYKTTDTYSKDHERGIRWDDPQIGINWPISTPDYLAPKDAAAPTLAEVHFSELG